MGRTPNQDHVARTLRALAILRSEPGWHHISRLAELVDARPARLSDDLRRCCYAADDWHLPLMFGTDIEPPHPDGDEVVQFAEDFPVSIPLPASRVELIRVSLLAAAAARRDPDNDRAPVLRALHERVTNILDADELDVRDAEPSTTTALRDAITNTRAVRFVYRSLTATAPWDRTVVPVRVHRQGRWWMLDAHPTDRSDGPVTVSYRLDRIVGDVHDAGPAPETPTVTASENEAAAPTTPVRLRMHDRDLWAVDDLTPTDIAPRADDHVEVTIHLFPPVGERLSRILYLTDPTTTTIIDGHTHLHAHRRHLLEF